LSGDGSGFIEEPVGVIRRNLIGVSAFNKGDPLEMKFNLILTFQFLFYFRKFDQIFLLEEFSDFSDEDLGRAVQHVPSLSVFVDVNTLNLKKLQSFFLPQPQSLYLYENINF